MQAMCMPSWCGRKRFYPNNHSFTFSFLEPSIPFPNGCSLEHFRPYKIFCKPPIWGEHHQPRLRPCWGSHRRWTRRASCYSHTSWSFSTRPEASATNFSGTHGVWANFLNSKLLLCWSETNDLEDILRMVPMRSTSKKMYDRMLPRSQWRNKEHTRLQKLTGGLKNRSWCKSWSINHID